MKASLPRLRPDRFSHLYIEEQVSDHPLTRKIAKKFDASHQIRITHYKEVFNRSGQSFAAQSFAKKLILAKKPGKFLHEGSPYSDGFGFEQFYYASTMMGCLYDCDYCYLQGLYSSANTVLFVNLEDAFRELEPLLSRLTLIATSYDTDTLAVEGLVAHTRQWLDYARNRPNLHLEIRTKSANFRALSDCNPNPNVTLAWTLSPQPIIERYEHATPSLPKRLKAIQEAIDAGWKVRVCIDPVIYTDDFESLYPDLIDTLFKTIRADSLSQLTLGSFRMSQSHLRSLKKLRRSDLAFYPYAVENDTVTYPEPIERRILDTLLSHATRYLPMERIRTWQRQ